MNKEFLDDVVAGLSSSPKRLSSKYFYDKKGDALFVQIMNMPEYYLTNVEFEIFDQQAEQIIDSWAVEQLDTFDLVELGAGDGTKTKKLLKRLQDRNISFRYLPVDISLHALEGLKDALSREFPSLEVLIKEGDYFEVLARLQNLAQPKVILFLGSNLGNLSDDAATEFLHEMSDNIQPGDKVLLGVDLIKKKSIVLPAYNDRAGITAAFNLNLLERINRELKADFNLAQFKHVARYRQKEGVARSFLESRENQKVHIGAASKSIYFRKGERIHTEISRKYSDEVLDKILNSSSLILRKKFVDAKGYFADYLLERTD